MIANTVLLAVGTIEMIPPAAPLTLFIWGPKRVVPVRLDRVHASPRRPTTPTLNPIRARVSLGLRVLSYSDLPHHATRATACSSRTRWPRRRWPPRARPATSAPSPAATRSSEAVMFDPTSRYAAVEDSDAHAARRPHGGLQAPPLPRRAAATLPLLGRGHASQPSDRLDLARRAHARRSQSSSGASATPTTRWIPAELDRARPAARIDPACRSR